jgi:hypothetical protein
LVTQWLVAVAQYLQKLAAAGDDQLTDGGTDRTYRNFHYTAQMLWRAFDEARDEVRLEAMGAVSPHHSSSDSSSNRKGVLRSWAQLTTVTVAATAAAGAAVHPQHRQQQASMAAPLCVQQ